MAIDSITPIVAPHSLRVRKRLPDEDPGLRGCARSAGMTHGDYKPSTRFAMMFFWISFDPPAIEVPRIWKYSGAIRN